MKQLDVAEQNVDATQHSVVSDEADVALKQLQFDRAQTLLTKGAGTVEARDIAETALRQSRAALERDKALEASADRTSSSPSPISRRRRRAEMAEITLGYTTLRAPFDGVILVREAELGEVVSPGVAIFTLDDLDHVWLRAYVNEPDIGKVRLGEEVTVTTDSYPGKSITGASASFPEQAEFTPKSVETHAERVTLVYRIRIDIDNPSHELLPGMPADANIPVGARPVMSEPAKPVIEVRNLTKRFGGAAAVQGLTLDCAKGEMFGFVGPDGAGKTTIMRLLAAVMTPDEGRS